MLRPHEGELPSLISTCLPEIVRLVAEGEAALPLGCSVVLRDDRRGPKPVLEDSLAKPWVDSLAKARRSRPFARLTALLSPLKDARE